jgi:hypothetical protein
MSKEAEAGAVERFKPYRTQESVARLGDVVRAKIERHRDRLEIEESSEVRGRLKELRDILRILSE